MCGLSFHGRSQFSKCYFTVKRLRKIVSDCATIRELVGSVNTTPLIGGNRSRNEPLHCDLARTEGTSMNREGEKLLPTTLMIASILTQPGRNHLVT